MKIETMPGGGYVVVDGTARILFQSLEMAKRYLLGDDEEMRSNVMLNIEPVESYLFYKWKMRTGQAIRVIDMPRSHVQNTLNWCIRKQAAPNEIKDNILYTQWIAYFIRRLLDPNLEE